MAVPACPLVLAMLDSEPRDAGGVAQGLARGGLGEDQSAHVAAAVALRRLQRAGLIYTGRTRRRERVFRITARGRRELALQRDVYRAVARL